MTKIRPPAKKQTKFPNEIFNWGRLCLVTSTISINYYNNYVQNHQQTEPLCVENKRYSSFRNWISQT